MARLRHTELDHTSLGSNATSVTSNWVQAADGTGGVVWSPQSGGSASFGSNANDVGNPSTGGASALAARTDHVHLGVRQITSNTSNTLTQPNINLVSGSGIAFDASVLSQLTIRATGASGGGSGSGVTIQYPALKPATPTYDFATASLPGAFVAHSTAGSFSTANCMTQGMDWVGSSMEMQFSGQFGALYVTHADSDFDFTWGGVIPHLPFQETAGSELMVGIAALDSSGTGVGVVGYTSDTNAYFATITTWGYTTFSDSWASKVMGTNLASGSALWFRLKRVSGTWTGYVSKSGRTWDKTFSTRADSITVDRLAIGIWFDVSKTYTGRLSSDYLQVDV